MVSETCAEDLKIEMSPYKTLQTLELHHHQQTKCQANILVTWLPSAPPL